MLLTSLKGTCRILQASQGSIGEDRLHPIAGNTVIIAANSAPNPDSNARMRGLAAPLLLATGLLLLACGSAAAQSAAAHPRIVGYATAWDAAEDKDAGRI